MSMANLIGRGAVNTSPRCTGKDRFPMSHQCIKVQTVCANPACGKQFLNFRSDQHKHCCRSCYNASRTRPVEELFWSHVEKTDGCWLWTAAVNRGGYGLFSVEKKTCKAHRYAWQFIYKQFLPAGFDLCHHCDVPHCVREDHLFVGTRADNMQDCKRKGRLHVPSPRGMLHHKAKLDPDKVREIRRLASEKKGPTEIGRLFGVTAGCIWDVVRGKNWKDVR